MTPENSVSPSRRTFLDRSIRTGAAVSTLALAARFPVHAANGDGKLKLGLIGCGGRMATYSGQEVRRDDAMASIQKLVPDGLVDFTSPAPVQPDAEGRYPVAIPGVTKPYEPWY